MVPCQQALRNESTKGFAGWCWGCGVHFLAFLGVGSGGMGKPHRHKKTPTPTQTQQTSQLQHTQHRKIVDNEKAAYTKKSIVYSN
jgi:hypothetical protein